MAGLSPLIEVSPLFLIPPDNSPVTGKFVLYIFQPTGHWPISVPIGSFWRTIYAWEEYIQSSPIFISYEFLYCSREIILLSLSYFSNWFIFPLKKRVTQIEVNMLPYHIHNQYVLPSPMFSCSIPICGSWRTWPFFSHLRKGRGRDRSWFFPRIWRSQNISLVQDLKDKIRTGIIFSFKWV